MYIRKRRGSYWSNENIALTQGVKGYLRRGDGLVECVEFTGNDKSWQPPC
jgi:hypothetical protein